MTPTRRQGKFLDTRQRSFHLTDDVYAIVQERAAAEGISNSGWISNLIRSGGAAPAAQTQEPLANEPSDPPRSGSATRKGAGPAAPANKRNIVLPDERASTFSVVKGARAKVQTKHLRSDDQLGGVERTPEEERKLRGRRGARHEEIEL